MALLGRPKSRPRSLQEAPRPPPETPSSRQDAQDRSKIGLRGFEARIRTHLRIRNVWFYLRFPILLTYSSFRPKSVSEGILELNFGQLGPSKAAKNTPRAARERPKSGPRATKSDPRAANRGPVPRRRAQERPRGAQDGLGASQRAPQGLPDPPPSPPGPPPNPSRMRKPLVGNSAFEAMSETTRPEHHSSSAVLFSKQCCLTQRRTQ